MLDPNMRNYSQRLIPAVDYPWVGTWYKPQKTSTSPDPINLLVVTVTDEFEHSFNFPELGHDRVASSLQPTT